MPRMGQFSGSTHVYGQPLSVIKPPDNRIPLYNADLLKYSADMHLTVAQRDELQRQIEEMYGVLQLTRDERLT